MTDLRELRNARVERADQDEVVAALVLDGPTTAHALARLPQFGDWSEDRLALALGSAWVDGSVTIDENDAFLSVRSW